MSVKHYILDEHGEPKLLKGTNAWLYWAEWLEESSVNGKRIVKQEWVGKARVSTVFLGLDHRFGEDGPPIFWEAMIFNTKLHGTRRRCSGGREQAEAMHNEMVAYAARELGVPLPLPETKPDGST